MALPECIVTVIVRKHATTRRKEGVELPLSFRVTLINQNKGRNKIK